MSAISFSERRFALSLANVSFHLAQDGGGCLAHGRNLMSRHLYSLQCSSSLDESWQFLVPDTQIWCLKPVSSGRDLLSEAYLSGKSAELQASWRFCYGIWDRHSGTVPLSEDGHDSRRICCSSLQ